MGTGRECASGDHTERRLIFDLDDGEEDLVALQLWWLIHKDLVSELRTRRTWGAMLLLGVVAAVVITAQTKLPYDYMRQICGVLLWLSVFFAGLHVIDRSCSSEQCDGCWDALRAYPVSPVVVYWSKFLVNLIALWILECLLVPLFVMLSGVDLLVPPWAIGVVAILANVGLSAVGTLLSGLANGIHQESQVLVLLVLPLVIPVIVAAAEATRLIAVGHIDAEWWRWVSLLGGFGAVYLTAGTVLFEFVFED
jgi:heme exporter protein B